MTDKPDGKRWGWGTAAWIVVALLVLFLEVCPGVGELFSVHVGAPQHEPERTARAGLELRLQWRPLEDRALGDDEQVQPVFLRQLAITVALDAALGETPDDFIRRVR